MKSLGFVALLVAALPYVASSTLTAQAQTGPSSFEAGGVQIIMPVPWKSAVEMGPEKRHFMDQFVPPSNRLIAGFVDADDLPNLHAEDIKAPPRTAVVAVSRQYESSNISESGFRQIIDSVSKNFDATVSNYAKDNEDSFNRRLRELDLDSAKITFAEPVSLGCLFSTPDTAGFGTIVQAAASFGSSEGTTQRTLTKALSILYVRAKNRVLFAYIYVDYKDKNTILWLRKASKDWASQIVELNK